RLSCILVVEPDLGIRRHDHANGRGVSRCRLQRGRMALKSAAASIWCEAVSGTHAATPIVDPSVKKNVSDARTVVARVNNGRRWWRRRRGRRGNENVLCATVAGCCKSDPEYTD